MTRRTDVPKLVWFAVALTFFNSWVLFEETVVDRFGLWRYMPLYRVARFCTWDVAVIALILVAVTRRSRVADVLRRFCPLRTYCVCR